MKAPNRWSDKRLKAIGQFSDESAGKFAADLVRRIRGIRDRTQCGSYLLADSERFIYLLAEEAATTQLWIRRCPKMVIGLYASGSPVFPTTEQIQADICAFLEEFLTAA